MILYENLNYHFFVYFHIILKPFDLLDLFHLYNFFFPLLLTFLDRFFAASLPALLANFLAIFLTTYLPAYFIPCFTNTLAAVEIAKSTIIGANATKGRNLFSNCVSLSDL